MSSRNRFIIYLFILSFLINLGVGSTNLINKEVNNLENVEKFQNQPKISASHSPITIIGDSELDAFCAGNGTTGTSWETAHVIENYEISSSGDFGIYLANTTRFLIIQNCIINLSSSNGMNLENCTNIKIQNCISESNLRGICMDECNKISISVKTFKFSYYLQDNKSR